jgi:nucleoside-diphosphate-sugar epimerase
MRTFRGIAERIVAISSQDVYRNYGVLLRTENTSPNVIPINEDAPLRSVLFPYRKVAEDPGDPSYNYDKIPVEREIMSDTELRGTVLRLPATYGPGDKQHRLFAYLKRMDDRCPFILIDENEARWRWTHGYVENVADAVALSVVEDRAANQIFNVGEEDAGTRKEWIETIGNAAGWDGEVVVLPRELLPEHLRSPYGYEHDLVVDTGRIREVLGYKEKVPNEKALQKTIAWERENPPTEIDPKKFDYVVEAAAVGKLRERGK